MRHQPAVRPVVAEHRLGIGTARAMPAIGVVVDEVGNWHDMHGAQPAHPPGCTTPAATVGMSASVGFALFLVDLRRGQQVGAKQVVETEPVCKQAGDSRGVVPKQPKGSVAPVAQDSADSTASVAMIDVPVDSRCSVRPTGGTPTPLVVEHCLKVVDGHPVLLL